MSSILIAVATLSWACASGRASAQSGGNAALRSARHTSAHADRVILVPTAETHPAGTLFFTAYEVVIGSVGYAFTDRVQGSIVALSDFSSTIFAELNLKANLLRSRYVRLAAAASIDYARGDEEELPFGRATAIAQLCFDLPCRSSVSFGASLVAHDAPDTILPLGMGAGFIGHVSAELDLLLEYAALLDAGASIELIDLPLYLVSYGVRVSAHPTWALDLSLARPMQADDSLRGGAPALFDLLGVPFIAFTYRESP